MRSSNVHLLPFLLLTALGCIHAQQCYFAGPRVDCGFLGITAEQCNDQGCCWLPAEFEGAPHIDVPWCFYSNSDPSSYAITSTFQGGGGGGGASKNTRSKGNNGSSNLEEATLELQESTLPQLGADIKRLKASIKEISPGILRFQLTDADKQRWQVPENLYLPESFAGGATSFVSKNNDSAESYGNSADIEWDTHPFALRISTPTSQSMFDSTGLRLVFKDQYLELSTHLDSSATLYGAGERASDTLYLIRNGMPRVLWNQDKGPTFLEENSYSSYPFVLALNKNTGNAWGYFMLNSNGMEIVPTADRLSWRMIGGVINLFILTGPTPAAVLDQMTAVVGRPTLMPYWSLGWQQSKYGYKTIWELEEVVSKYAENGLPLETIVTDIDYMDRWKDFTFDPINYPLEEMQRFVAALEKKGQKWVPIVDPGISVLPGYEPYDTGIKENIFLKEYDGRTSYLGWCWPGPAHFPDFLAEAGQNFLKKFLTSWHAAVPFSGVWIDMNEASNFCSGDMCQLTNKKDIKKNGGKKTIPTAIANNRSSDDVATVTDDPPPWVCQLDCTKDIRPELNSTMLSFLEPPYSMSSSLNNQNLGTKGLSVLATHLDGSLQYNTHNIYGLAECQATNRAVREIIGGKRPFVLSRSSFTGVGAYAAHWSGDNAASWQSLAQSLPQILSYGLNGIPMGGADTGFSGDISEELCARWASLGAIAYPFARSHSDLHSRHQEPYLWPSVLEATKKSLEMRYKLLSYFYTLHRIASENGMPVMRPLWLNYPQDGRTHELDRQVMLGEAFLVTPVLEEKVKKVKGYFPSGTVWYDMFEESERIDARSGAKEVEVSASLTKIPVPLHMAGGNIVALHTFEQGDFEANSLVTAQVRCSPLTLVVALQHPIVAGGSFRSSKEIQTAEGFMFLDDGESVNAFGAADCNFLTFSARVQVNAGEVNISFGVPQGFAYSDEDIANKEGIPVSCQGLEWPELHKVRVLGWGKEVSSARLEVVSQARDASENYSSTDLQWTISKHLEFTISEGFRALKYPAKLTLIWSSASGAGKEDVLPVRGGMQKEPVLAVDNEYLERVVQ